MPMENVCGTNLTAGALRKLLDDPRLHDDAKIWIGWATPDDIPGDDDPSVELVDIRVDELDGQAILQVGVRLIPLNEFEDEDDEEEPDEADEH